MTEEQIREAYDLLRRHQGPFKVYANPMRADGVFVGQDKPPAPYPGVRGIAGPIYPAVPFDAYVLPYQVPREVADRLLSLLHETITRQ
jgi:hypothetical protein